MHLLWQSCLKCHDSDASAGAGNGGAKSSAAWVPSGSALRPFNTAPTQTPGNNVLDVNAHFATANASYHPIRGKQNNSYADTDTMSAPWNYPAKTADTITQWGYLMTCWDCHDSSSAPRTIGGATASSTAHGGAVTLRAAYNSTSGAATPLCVVCHMTSAYWTTWTHTANLGVSALNTDSPANCWVAGGDHDFATGRTYYGCTQCHGTSAFSASVPGRPINAINAHGFNTLADGVTTTWPIMAPATVAARPWNFLRYSNNVDSWRPRMTGALTNGACDGTNMCGRGESALTYTPGGRF